MRNPFKTPEQLLAYKPLKRVLAAKATGTHAVAPNTSTLDALRLMADKEIGFLVVLGGAALVGVVSERDYARKVILQGKTSGDTPVEAIMTRDVVRVGLAQTIPECAVTLIKTAAVFRRDRRLRPDGRVLTTQSRPRESAR
ncbi:MAG: CBS domain-containing protein [Caldimonas sp.]